MTGFKQHVSAIGGANIDVHGRSHRELKHNDSNPGNVHLSAGGVARNVAENLARLDVDSRLITAVGDDERGKMLQQLSSDAGINMQYVLEIPSGVTSTYLSVLDNNGDMLVGISEMSIIDQLDAELLQTHQAMLEQSSLVIIDCNLTDDALGWLAKSLGDTPIFADTVSSAKAARLRPYLHAIHTLKTSTIEVEALTGRDAGNPDQLQDIADHLHGEGVERVFVTRGEDGVFYSTREDRGVSKLNRSQQINNAGGAGDAFLAGLAYAWLRDLPLQDSTQFALAAADITMSDPATSSPALSVAAVNQLLETRRAS
jgi:pseudouridine kinase